MSWLDQFLAAYNVVQQGGTPVIQRQTLNFVSGVTIADDPVNARTNVTVSGGGGSLPTILQNRVQHLQTTNNLGVSGGGNFVAPATITMVASGKVRVTVNASFQSNAIITPIVSAVVNGGSSTVVWSFQQVTGNFSVAVNGNIGTTFELDTAATVGQTVQISFTSTSGDGSFSSFVLGTGDACAGILLEELP